MTLRDGDEDTQFNAAEVQATLKVTKTQEMYNSQENRTKS